MCVRVVIGIVFAVGVAEARVMSCTYVGLGCIGVGAGITPAYRSLL